ncbi:uncharacterized [Tachysurus ichikawai]
MKSRVMETSSRTACVKSSADLIQRCDLAVGRQVDCGAVNEETELSPPLWVYSFNSDPCDPADRRSH